MSAFLSDWITAFTAGFMLGVLMMLFGYFFLAAVIGGGS